MCQFKCTKTEVVCDLSSVRHHWKDEDTHIFVEHNGTRTKTETGASSKHVKTQDFCHIEEANMDSTSTWLHVWEENIFEFYVHL